MLNNLDSPPTDNERSTFASAYAQVLGHLERAGIRYAVLHGWHSLGQQSVSDLDLIVAVEDLSRTEMLLNTHYRILNAYRYESSSVAFVLSCTVEPFANTLLVDISTDYRCRGLIFFTAEQLLCDRQRWSNYWVVASQRELEYLLIKKIYEKGVIPESQRVRIEWLVYLLGRDKAAMSLCHHFGDRWGKQLISWIGTQRWDLIRDHIRQLQHSLARQAAKRQPSSLVRYWYNELCRVWSRIHYPTGASIAIVPAGVWAHTHVINASLLGVERAFRRTVTLEPGFLSRRAEVPVSVMQRILRMIQAMVLECQIRALTVRSALVICQINNGTGSVGMQYNPCDVPHRIIPVFDILFKFCVPSTASAAVDPQGESANLQLLARETVFLDGRLSHEQLAKRACSALEDLLWRRYQKYRGTSRVLEVL